MRLLASTCLLLASIPTASQAQFAAPGTNTSFAGFSTFNNLSDRRLPSVGRTFGQTGTELGFNQRPTAVRQPREIQVDRAFGSTGGLTVPADPRGQSIAGGLNFPAAQFQQFLGTFELPEGVPMEDADGTDGVVTNTANP